MAYDPSARGPFPVGVRTIEFRDAPLAARPIPAEIWYPATDAYRGKDLDDASRDRFVMAPGFPVSMQHAVRDAAAVAGMFPMFLYFHGGYGHRREATGLCTHMASHVLAHMDAHLKGSRDAQAFLDGDLEGSFAGQGIRVTVTADSSAVPMAV